MKTIPIRRGGRAVASVLVDDEDYAVLSRRTWQLGTHGYPVATINGKSQLMHRVILGLRLGDGLQTDHVNRDKMDNRRANLRLATYSENSQNRDRPSGEASRYRGVSLTSDGRRWRATAILNQRQVYIGTFADELEAARAASSWRAEHMPFSPDARGEGIAVSA